MLKTICSHPEKIVNDIYTNTNSNFISNENLNILKKMTKASEYKISSYKQSSKLLGLLTLLDNLGIKNESNRNNLIDNIDNKIKNRVLIFAQSKSFLTKIENDIFKKLLPKVKYLKMDGSVSNSNRFQLVQNFNKNDNILCMLLTTRVGGVGLNLTGANTVIFMEHDWNPSVDLQAMDRTHRIGQKKTVNVYRLLTKDTIEDRIMSLQRFKIDVMNTVVGNDNKSIKSMELGSILNKMDQQKIEEKKIITMKLPN